VAADPMVVPLQDAARKIGAWCWAERRCFELLGGWVHDTPEPSVKALFARHSRHHAWRSERWAEILPGAYVPPPAELTAPTAEASWFDRMGTDSPSASRLVGHYHVLYPALLAAYDASPVVMHPVTDGPALRAIRIILGDARHDLAEAETVIQQFRSRDSGLPDLVDLRGHVENSLVSQAGARNPASAFRRWGS
jgi:hypothetical protein